MSVKRRLSQYAGVLTSAQIAQGMNASTQNAKRLAEDARLMLDHGRCASAVGLAILSIEESGKHRVLRELALFRNDEELRSAWREYRQHTSKNQLWPLIDSVSAGAAKLQDFAHLFDPDSEHPQLLDQLKQVSLYTDCLGNVHWSIPEKVTDVDLAKHLVEIATLLSHSREITPEEIDLWIFYLQPVYKTTTHAMEAALVAWDKEMRSRGLLKDDGPTMDEFVSRGFRPQGKP